MPKKENKELLKYRLDLEEFTKPLPPGYISPLERRTKDRYPGVPSPDNMIWERNDDDKTPDPTDERNAALLDAARALDQAAAACRALVARVYRMTVEDRNAFADTITSAIHKAEDQLSEFYLDYPLSTEHRYRRTHSQKHLENLTPKMLNKEDDHLLFWMPPLPAKSFSSNSLIFTEFSDILYCHYFTPIKEWHCSFYHVHKEDDFTGVRDVDNYPYKPIIDAIARAILAKDSGDNFSFSVFNLTSNTLHPGCYIDVCNRTKKVLDLAEFEKFASSLK